MLRILNREGIGNALIEVRRTYARDVSLNLDIIYFDGVTGAVLANNSARPAMTVQRVIGGLHMSFSSTIGRCVESISRWGSSDVC